MPVIDASLYPLIATCLAAGGVAGLLLCLAFLLPRLRAADRDRREHEALIARFAALRATLGEREKQHKAQAQLLRDSRDQLSREFENLANRIFDDKQQRFHSSSQRSLRALLEPFREQVQSFQSRIDRVHTDSLKGNTALEGEIRRLLELGMQMNSQAEQLASALKGDNKVLGTWGETQLQQSLEQAGLLPGEHFESQASFSTADGRRLQPDFVVKLPGQRHLVIDSKVSLLDWIRAVEAADEAQRKSALTSLVASMKRHIDSLSGKDYGNLPALGSPSFVLLFTPVEPAFMEALRTDRGLFDYGCRRNVIMVSPTTLMPVLRTVSNLWMIDRSHREVRDIADAAGDLFNQVCTLTERLATLGKTLGTAGRHYNDAVTALVGRQGLHGKVDRFRQLSTRANKQLPEIEELSMDEQSERLDLAVQNATRPD
jgi:DNA recombination protein RmuC